MDFPGVPVDFYGSSIDFQGNLIDSLGSLINGAGFFPLVIIYTISYLPRLMSILQLFFPWDSGRKKKKPRPKFDLEPKSEKKNFFRIKDFYGHVFFFQTKFRSKKKTI